MKGLFVDFDGTLANSLEYMKQCYYLFLQKNGIDGSEAEFQQLNGPPLHDIVLYLKKKYSLSQSAADLKIQYEKLIEENFLALMPTENMIEVLEKGIRNGYVISIVTSNKENLVRKFLQVHSLSKYISLVVGGESVKEGKPSPAPYLLALIKSGCDVEKSFAIEDSPQGVISAAKAKLKTFFLLKNSKPEMSDDFEKIKDKCIFINEVNELLEKSYLC